MKAEAAAAEAGRPTRARKVTTKHSSARQTQDNDERPTANRLRASRSSGGPS